MEHPLQTNIIIWRGQPGLVQHIFEPFFKIFHNNEITMFPRKYYGQQRLDFIEALYAMYNT